MFPEREDFLETGATVLRERGYSVSSEDMTPNSVVGWGGGERVILKHLQEGVACYTRQTDEKDYIQTRIQEILGFEPEYWEERVNTDEEVDYGLTADFES